MTALKHIHICAIYISWWRCPAILSYCLADCVVAIFLGNAKLSHFFSSLQQTNGMRWLLTFTAICSFQQANTRTHTVSRHKPIVRGRLCGCVFRICYICFSLTFESVRNNIEWTSGAFTNMHIIRLFVADGYRDVLRLRIFSLYNTCIRFEDHVMGMGGAYCLTDKWHTLKLSLD